VRLAGITFVLAVTYRSSIKVHLSTSRSHSSTEADFTALITFLAITRPSASVQLLAITGAVMVRAKSKRSALTPPILAVVSTHAPQKV